MPRRDHLKKASAYFVYADAFSDYSGRTGKGKTGCVLVIQWDKVYNMVDFGARFGYHLCG